MPFRNRNDALAYEAFARCQTCGRDRPASKIWLHPRFGWQCEFCWDAGPQHDEYMQPIFPYEGTRKTPAPLTQTLTEGVSRYDSTWTLRDRATGTLYDLQFTQFIDFTTPSVTGNDPAPGFVITGGYFVYIQNGIMQYDRNPVIGSIIWNRAEAIWVDENGVLNYIGTATPPTPLIVPLADVSNGLVYLVTFGPEITFVETSLMALGNGFSLVGGYVFYLSNGVWYWNQSTVSSPIPLPVSIGLSIINGLLAYTPPPP